MPDGLYTEKGVISSDGTVIAMPDRFGNPVYMQDGVRIEADRILFNSKLKSAAAVGEVKVDRSGLRIIADGADYRSVSHRLDTGHVRMGRPPVLMEADKVTLLTAANAKVDTSVATLDRVKVYFNEPDFLVISMTAARLTYDAGTDTLHLDDMTLRVGPVPILYLPSFTQEGLDGPPVDPEIQVGENSRYGPYLRTTTFYTANRRWEPGLSLDLYGRAGVLAGPDFRYDSAKVVKGDDDSPTYNVMKGTLVTGFIDDHSNRGLDQFNNPIPESRNFVEWRHKQTIDDTVEITAVTDWWSDPQTLRDLRPQLFAKNQVPDNFVEVVYPDRDFYASVFTRYNPNNWQDVDQRLPEVRFDLNPREIADTKIYQRGYVDIAYLEENPSEELPALPGVPMGTSLVTPRFDAYYGLTRPFTPGSAFTFTPVAGVRTTTWFNSPSGGQATFSRTAGQLGFDAQAVAQGKWDYDDTLWEINGLRHQIRPVIQYRYLPGVTQGEGEIPLIDRWAFLTAPPPIDLSQRRDTDELHETQILRLGVENLFQTRDKEYGSRNLVSFDVYQDLRQTDRAGDRPLSDTYLRQQAKPASWLDLQMYERVSPYTGAVHEFSTQAVISDGDRWKIRLGTQRMTDAPLLDPNLLAVGIYQYGPKELIDQYLVGWEYRLNAQFTLKALWRYDAIAGTLSEQSYGVVQQLGHTWQIEYGVGKYSDAREGTGVQAFMSLRLKTF